MRPFDDRDRTDWHYTPRSRNGVSLQGTRASEDREAVHALLQDRAVGGRLPQGGQHHRARAGAARDRDLRHDARPGALPPHRLRRARPRQALGLALRGPPPVAQLHARRRQDGGRHARASSAPTRRRCRRARRRACARSARSTTPAGRCSSRSATRSAARRCSTSAPTARSSPATRTSVEPLEAAGIPAAKLDEKQRALLWKLVETYARSFEPGLAEARLARAKQGGIEAIRFGWAGSTKRGGQHYYRVQGPLFLIEYDASQNDGNHIHTVWRDFNGDFGRDLLREHYQAALGTRHRH